MVVNGVPFITIRHFLCQGQVSKVISEREETVADSTSESKSQVVILVLLAQ